MANIMRRGGGSMGPTVTRDPFEMMRELIGWDPISRLGIAPLEGRDLGFVPDFEVKETKDSYVFKADLPGIRDEDLDISLTGSRLTVSGRREVEERDEGDTYYTWERSFGSFSRSFTLPEGIDGEHVNAELKDGVLKLVLPKVPEVQPKKISVKGTTEKTLKGAKA